MNTKTTFAIGVMSGTSLDGVDLVYVKFTKDDVYNFDIIHATTIPYNKEWKQLLQNALFSTSDELESLDVLYGSYLGNLIANFIANYKINHIDFIASHGHTILHEPENGVTLQVGSGKKIAAITNKKVVCDFRTQDVKLGGQGAPLVPIGDELLFSEYDYCLNLGGFSNVSFTKGNCRIAFDICPVNIVLNHYVSKLGFAFDESGKIASKGVVNTLLLEKLNALDFYKKLPPKSLGLEWVQKEIFPLIDSFEKDIANVLATFSLHAAMQIAAIIKGSDKVLVTGGGAFNSFLMSQISTCSKITIKQQSPKIIDFKEALIFAFLGLLRIDNQVNCLKSVTGAIKDHSSGVIFYP
ncbi:anhydro-N-acetylmuramic acid kinase [Polaribacter tangerinus]|uniref:anhydro-N-acetylmuramic acid kinase n=1 Tax=Polaribacter tangerinus TaxID=1920034 RepID=UPI000B4A5723|nr:anhydro-N-acetylmuramic acid kinase [Polaribacter tangerinus]